MSPSLNLRTVLYYLLVMVSVMVCVFFAIINTTEVINRRLNHDTLFSQMSWLTDKQAILYCGILIVVFISLLTVISFKFYHKRQREVVFFAVLALLIGVLMLFVDTLFYYKPV